MSGYGGNAFFAAQYALLLKKGGHNVLCIAEKAPDEAEARIVLETDRAVYQGDAVPSLLIDTGGDSLFYTYRHAEGEAIASERYHSIKQNGEWSSVGICIFQAPEEGRYPELWIFETEGQAYLQRYWSDENDSLLERGERVAVDVDFIRPLSEFEIRAAMDWYLQSVDPQ